MKIELVSRPERFCKRLLLMLINSMVVAVLLMSSATISLAQTSTFTYQGRLTDGGAAPNGAYDFQFKLFDGGGSQIGSTISNGAVQVSSGVFTVQLDFGAVAFSGPDRFLEIGLRPAGSNESFTILAPRQQLTSAVYAIRAGSTTTADTATTAADATQLGGIPANQYVITNDPRLSDARTPTAGSANYIQNSINQQGAAFNITGDGRANTLSGNIINAYVHYNLNGARIMTGAFNNMFVGIGAGSANTGNSNAFFGGLAGLNNTSGSENSFFGIQAGQYTDTGHDNSFLGLAAGRFNTTGSDNGFFGAGAGMNNSVASNNSFFGSFTGFANTTGERNSFFGRAAGFKNDTGSDNSFFGFQAGHENTASGNSFFGANAGSVNISGGGNAFYGMNAGRANKIGGSNSFFGHNSGSFTDADSNSFFGSNSGFNNTTGYANTFVGFNAGNANVDGSLNTVVGFGAGSGAGTSGSLNTFLGASAGPGVTNLSNASAIGYNARVTQSNSLVLGSIGPGVPDTSVGIGTSAPAFRLTVKTGANNYGMVHTDGTIIVGTYVGGSANGGYLGTKSNHSLNFFVNDGGPSLSIDTGGVVHVNTLGSAGSTTLCRNASNQIATCSSSLRYKKNIRPFTAGLSLVNRLRPITFDWRQGGGHDLGFGAEEIAAIEPLLVTRNDKGEVEGVKYDRIAAVLVNAVKEQQAQIEAQREQLSRQQNEIDTLKALVSRRHRRASVRK